MPYYSAKGLGVRWWCVYGWDPDYLVRARIPGLHPKSILAKGKYGCTEVRVYPAECGEQLGRDPSKTGSSKSPVSRVFLGREHFGTRPCQSPSRFGIRLHFKFYAPTSPPPTIGQEAPSLLWRVPTSSGRVVLPGKW